MSFRAMNLLLLLSALLSALSGIGSSARTPDLAQAVAGAGVVAARVTPTAVQTARRPVAELPTRTDVAAEGLAPAMPHVARVPVWADRRRE